MATTFPWQTYRQPVLECIDEYLAAQPTIFPAMQDWATDTSQRVNRFVQGGKTVRGALVGWMSYLLADDVSPAAVRVGAAIELVHATMMIHDDIIDQDIQRHGQPTLYAQYQTLATTKRYRQPLHYGQSLALCVGDLSLFWANDLLLHDSLRAEQQRALIRLVSHNLKATGLAEMMDTDAGFDAQQLSPDVAMAISTYKTARYTFCLPFGAAAILTNQSAAIQHDLDTLGELIGLLYQTRDDELGLYGEATTTGKAVGADIRERKKTLYLTNLYQQLSTADQQKLITLLEADTISQTDVDWVLDQIEQTGVRTQVSAQMTAWQAQAATVIDHLPMATPNRSQLHELTVFVRERQK